VRQSRNGVIISVYTQILKIFLSLHSKRMCSESWGLRGVRRASSTKLRESVLQDKKKQKQKKPQTFSSDKQIMGKKKSS